MLSDIYPRRKVVMQQATGLHNIQGWSCVIQPVSVRVTSHEAATIVWQTVSEADKCGSVYLVSLSWKRLYKMLAIF